ALLERALAIHRRVHGDEHPEIASVLDGLANVELSENRLTEARDHAQAAIAMYRKTQGDDFPVTSAQRILGDAYLRLGQPAKAVEPLELSLASVTDQQDPSLRAWIECLLGRALVESGRDPARGRALVVKAWAVLSKDERTDELAATLKTWMTRRGIPTR
ncbi:MAG TPA: tetratricopeptide repeat protein, partial [Kofleriaceae bacterium]|nr:tetratricopeptide repeat protein [Kofleriaceae bacterium]